MIRVEAVKHGSRNTDGNPLKRIFSVLSRSVSFPPSSFSFQLSNFSFNHAMEAADINIRNPTLFESLACWFFYSRCEHSRLRSSS